MTLRCPPGNCTPPSCSIYVMPLCCQQRELSITSDLVNPPLHWPSSLPLSLAFLSTAVIGLPLYRCHWPSSLPLSLAFLSTAVIGLPLYRFHWPSSLPLSLAFLSTAVIGLPLYRCHWPSSLPRSLAFLSTAVIGLPLYRCHCLYARLKMACLGTWQTCPNHHSLL